MHLHRGFGDADIVGNLFAQAGRAPLEWELVEVDDALRPPAGASKVHESFLDASLPRQSRQPCWAASRADRRADYGRGDEADRAGGI